MGKHLFKHWKWLLSLLFGIVVACYWGFLRMSVLSFQEQYQLFLTDTHRDIPWLGDNQQALHTITEMIVHDNLCHMAGICGELKLSILNVDGVNCFGGIVLQGHKDDLLAVETAVVHRSMDTAGAILYPMAACHHDGYGHQGQRPLKNTFHRLSYLIFTCFLSSEVT